jgi:hypothetical protein
MLQTAYDNEHVYKRWEYILTCMLGKDIGIPRIHRLRVIHLYECDLNLLFSIFFENWTNTVKTTISLIKEYMAVDQVEEQ